MRSSSFLSALLFKQSALAQKLFDSHSLTASGAGKIENFLIIRDHNDIPAIITCLDNLLDPFICGHITGIHAGDRRIGKNRIPGRRIAVKNDHHTVALASRESLSRNECQQAEPGIIAFFIRLKQPVERYVVPVYDVQ